MGKIIYTPWCVSWCTSYSHVERAQMNKKFVNPLIMNVKVYTKCCALSRTLIALQGKVLFLNKC